MIRFLLTIKSNTWCTISRDMRYPGINALDQIRKDLKKPDLSVELIQGYISSFGANLDVEFTETEARVLGIFEEKGHAVLRISKFEDIEAQLNEFVKLETWADLESDGSVKMAGLKWVVNKEAAVDYIIKNWDDLESRGTLEYD